MPLTTPAAAIEQLNANNLYDLNGSASEARLFIEAARALLGGLLPKRSKHGRAGAELEYDPATIQEQLTKAEHWIRVNGSGRAGGVKHADFSDFRA
jgi:hypothetical protein